MVETPNLENAVAVITAKRNADFDAAMHKGVCAGLGIDDSQIKNVTLEWGEIMRGGAIVAIFSQLRRKR